MIDEKQNNNDKEESKTSENLDKSNEDLDKNNDETNIEEKKDETNENSDNQTNDTVLEKDESNNLTNQEVSLKDSNQEPDEKKDDPNEIEKKEEEKNNLDTKNETVEEKNIEENKESSNDNDIDSKDIKWYVIQAHSGFEDKAVETIKANAKKKGMSDCFEDFKIPTHDSIEVRKGKKINVEKKFFPGYFLVKMKMDNETWQLVKKSNKVSGFVGNDHNPVPLSDNEALKMLKKADDTVEYIAPQISYEVGEQVKVSDGPFASFNGMVEEVDEDKGKLKVSVSIFGRSTPVELDYTQVEKM